MQWLSLVLLSMLCCCPKLWRFHQASQVWNTCIFCKHISLSLCCFYQIHFSLSLYFTTLVVKQEWDRYASKNNVDRTNPANLQLGRSPVYMFRTAISHLVRTSCFFFMPLRLVSLQEWDLLAKESMLYRSAILKLRGPFAPPKRKSKMWVDATTFK